MMTALTQQAIRGVPSPHIILPSPSPAPSPVKARAQLRIPRDRRRQLASEASLPLYMPLPSGPLATQSHPFSSQLLSSAQNERRGVAWQLLPGWEGYDSLSESGAAINTGQRLILAGLRHLCLPSEVNKVAASYLATTISPAFDLSSWLSSPASEQYMESHSNVIASDKRLAQFTRVRVVTSCPQRPVRSLYACSHTNLPIVQHAKRCLVVTSAFPRLTVASHAAGSLHDYAARPAAAVSKPGDKMTGRYYQLATHNNADSPAATAATEAAAAAAGDAAPEVKDAEGPEADNDQRRAVLKELEQQTVANPGNQDVWLQYALEQIDYGAVDSMQGRRAVSGVYACAVVLCLCLNCEGLKLAVRPTA